MPQTNKQTATVVIISLKVKREDTSEEKRERERRDLSQKTNKTNKESLNNNSNKQQESTVAVGSL